MSQKLKNLPAMQEIWFQSLGWEDPSKKGVTTCSSILASCIENFTDRGACQATVHGIAKSQT